MEIAIEHVNVVLGSEDSWCQSWCQTRRKPVSKLNPTGTTEFTTALNDVSVTVPAGSISLVIGPSGSGKSTLIQVMGKACSVSSGQVQHRVVPPASEIKGMIVSATQRRGLLMSQTVAGTIEMAVALADPHGYPRSKHLLLTCELMRAMMLEMHAEALVSTLSNGELIRLEIALGLAVHPTYLLLDDCIDSLTVAERSPLINILSDAAKLGETTTVLVCNTPTTDLVATADNIIVLAAGHLVCAAPKADALAFLGGAQTRMRDPVELLTEAIDGMGHFLQSYGQHHSTFNLDTDASKMKSGARPTASFPGLSSTDTPVPFDIQQRKPVKRADDDDEDGLLLGSLDRKDNEVKSNGHSLSHALQLTVGIGGTAAAEDKGETILKWHVLHLADKFAKQDHKLLASKRSADTDTGIGPKTEGKTTRKGKELTWLLYRFLVATWPNWTAMFWTCATTAIIQGIWPPASQDHLVAGFDSASVIFATLIVSSLVIFTLLGDTRTFVTVHVRELELGLYRPSVLLAANLINTWAHVLVLCIPLLALGPPNGLGRFYMVLVLHTSALVALGQFWIMFSRDAMRSVTHTAATILVMFLLSGDCVPLSRMPALSRWFAGLSVTSHAYSTLLNLAFFSSGPTTGAADWIRQFIDPQMQSLPQAFGLLVLLWILYHLPMAWCLVRPIRGKR